jgi:hypothetical protein
VTVEVERHDDARMAEQFLDHLGRQPAAPALFRVDAPAGEEVPEGVHGVFRLADPVYNTGCDHYGRQGAQDLLMVGYSSV